MQMPVGALGMGMRDLLSLGPLFKTRGASSLRSQRSFAAPYEWLECSTALQAGLSTIGLFNFSLPPARYSPACIIGLRRAALPLLDAMMYGSVESPALREKLELLLSVLKVAGEMWPMAKSIGIEISDVLREADATNNRTMMPHFDPNLDAFINGMASSGNMEDPHVFSFPEPRTADEILQWTAGLTGTYSVKGFSV